MNQIKKNCLHGGDHDYQQFGDAGLQLFLCTCCYKEKPDECPKGGRHEFEMKKGELGQTYDACAKCGCGPMFNGHLGFG